MSFLEAEGEWIAAAPSAFDLPDLGDQPFAEVAVAAGADCLVTDNPRHFPPAQLPRQLRVVTPAAFLDAVARRE